jgi:hypothetical protein
MNPLANGLKSTYTVQNQPLAAMPALPTRPEEVTA